MQHARAHLLLGAPRQLVAHHDLADRQTRARTDLEQFLARVERELDGRRVLHDTVGAERVLVDDEPASDGVVDALEQHRSVSAERPSDHAVRVPGQRLAAVQDEVVAVKGHLAQAAEQKAVGLLDRVETRVRGVGVDRLRVLTHQAEDDRLVGAVPVAGLPERPAQFDLDARDVVEEPCLAQGFEEPPRGSHGTDGVGRRGSDTDRVQFECTQRHATPSIMRTDSHTMWPHE